MMSWLKLAILKMRIRKEPSGSFYFLSAAPGAAAEFLCTALQEKVKRFFRKFLKNIFSCNYVDFVKSDRKVSQGKLYEKEKAGSYSRRSLGAFIFCFSGQPVDHFRVFLFTFQPGLHSQPRKRLFF